MLHSKRYPLTTDDIVNASGESGFDLSSVLDTLGASVPAEIAVAEFKGPTSQTAISGLTTVVFGSEVRSSHSGLWGIASDGTIWCAESGNTIAIMSCMTDVTDNVVTISRWLPYLWSGSSWDVRADAIGWNINYSSAKGETSSARAISFNATGGTTRVRMSAAEVSGTNAVLAANGSSILLFKLKN